MRFCVVRTVAVGYGESKHYTRLLPYLAFAYTYNRKHRRTKYRHDLLDYGYGKCTHRHVEKCDSGIHRSDVYHTYRPTKNTRNNTVEFEQLDFQPQFLFYFKTSYFLHILIRLQPKEKKSNANALISTYPKNTCKCCNVTVITS